VEVDQPERAQNLDVGTPLSSWRCSDACRG
jgi:hypothetical protein